MKLTNEMEQWIEKKLWNKKVIREPIIISKIVSEFISTFKIKLTAETKNQLALKITPIRRRIYRRYKKWRDCREEMAKKTKLPPRLVERWLRAGWLDPSNPVEIQGRIAWLLDIDDYQKSHKEWAPSLNPDFMKE